MSMLVAAGLTACAVMSLSTEWRIKRLSSLQMLAGRTHAGDALLPYSMAPDDMTAREQLLSAAFLARTAAGETGREREATLVRARRLVERAQSARPLWAQSDIVQAYIVGLTQDGVNPQSSAWLERSYDHAPFLDQSSDWRIRYVVAAWPAASAILRQRAIDEAIWQSTKSAAMYVHIKLLLEGTAAWRPYLGRRGYLVRSGQLST